MLKTLSQRHISWTHADFPVQHHSAPPSSSSFKASSPKSSDRPSESIAKTSELSEEVKSITPDKEHDVIMNEVEMGAAAAEGGTLLGEQQQHYRREGQNSGTGDHDIVMAEAKHGAGAGGSGKNGGDGASNAHHNGDHGSHNQQSGDSKVKSEEPTGAAQPSEATSDNNVPESNHLLYIGTLSYSEQEGSRRQHQIRGNWKYENSPASAIPQRFELIRAIPPDEDLKDLPKDGEYHGTFSLAFEFTTSKGKKKAKRKSVTESGVKIKFTKEAEPGVFSVEGKGVNDYGTFELVGTATKSKMEDDPGYHVRLKKIYTVTTHPPAQQQQSSAESEKKKSGKKSSAIEAEPTEEATAVKPPPPTVLPPVNVVCLRGKLSRNTSENLSLGLGDVIHKITGIWAMGLNHILDDPDNTKALCNKFEYEHKCSGESTVFPLSGKYTGWFYVSNKKSGETTVTTLTTTTPAPGLLNASRDKKAALPPIPPMEDLQLSFDDVEAPDGSELVPVVQAPLTYGAVSKVIEWDDNEFLPFWNPSHIAAEDAKTMLERMDKVGATDHDDRRINIPDRGGPTMLNNETFPIDSVRYRGSFKMRKGVSKSTTVRDDQIVLKFVKNTSGSYNVYGKGINNMGVYDIVGTLILQTSTSGHLILYRVYPLVLAEPEHIPPATAKSSGKVFPGSLTEKAVGGRPMPAMKPPEKFTPSASSLQRRESSRQVKVPVRLEEDDPRHNAHL
eukprot:CCRYP_019948-RA/>CCRYP_019948-RA protein AED:0.36 eAED:0.37 QI:0/0/0/1/1/1/3/0/727